MLPGLAVLSLLCAEPSYELFTDKGDLFVRAGSKAGLKVGVEVNLLGEGGKVVGTAAVMEVWESLARLVPDEAAKKAGPKSAQLAAAPAAPKSADGCADPAREVEDVSYAFGVRDDELTAFCCKTRVKVLVHGTAMGAAFQLFVDDRLVDQQEPYSGTDLVLKGKSVSLKVKVGTFGGDYVLKVGGKPCQLKKE